MKLHLSLRNFLPNDTRLLELISGISLTLYMVVTLSTDRALVPIEFLEYHVWQFWMLVLGAIGVVQIAACAQQKVEYLRAATNWMAGSYWVWMGVYQLDYGYYHAMTIVSMLIGLGCLYAFVVNLLLARQAWKH